MPKDPRLSMGSRIHSFSQCYDCPLFEGKECSKIVHGFGNQIADIMFIGEAPGFNEDIKRIPFIGKSGIQLRQLINEVMEISEYDVFLTNVVRCHPTGNRNPEKHEVSACSKYLKEEILTINPRLIVTVGIIASKAILGREFLKISRDRRRIFQSDLCDTIVPIAHPASNMRGTDAEKLQKKQHLKLDFYKLKDIYDKIILKPKTKVVTKQEGTFGLW